MNHTNRLKTKLVSAADPQSRDNAALLLEYFADKVDNSIQAELESDLMTRYAGVSRLLEEKTAC